MTALTLKYIYCKADAGKFSGSSSRQLDCLVLKRVLTLIPVALSILDQQCNDSSKPAGFAKLSLFQNFSWINKPQPLQWYNRMLSLFYKRQRDDISEPWLHPLKWLINCYDYRIKMDLYWQTINLRGRCKLTEQWEVAYRQSMFFKPGIVIASTAWCLGFSRLDTKTICFTWVTVTQTFTARQSGQANCEITPDECGAGNSSGETLLEAPGVLRALLKCYQPGWNWSTCRYLSSLSFGHFLSWQFPM